MATEREMAEASPRPWGICELPWDDRGTAIYSPPGDPHGARLICDTDVTEMGLGDPDDDGSGVLQDMANAALIVRAVNAHDAALALADAATVIHDRSGSEAAHGHSTVGMAALCAALAAFREASKP